MTYTRCLAFLLAFSNLCLFMPAAVRAAPVAGGQVIAAIDEKAETGRMVSQKISELREAGREEFKSSQLLKEELGKLGFKVTENLPVPPDLVEGGISKTAFRAELAEKGPGPTITISSDLGNVGHAYPTMNLMLKATPGGTALHSDEFREAAASESAWMATVIAAKAVALTAHQLLTQPNKTEEIKSKFKELKE